MPFTLGDSMTLIDPETALDLLGTLSRPVVATNRKADLLIVGSRVPYLSCGPGLTFIQ